MKNPKNKNYRIFISEFGEKSISGTIEQWNEELQEYEQMSFLDSTFSVQFDGRFYELRKFFEIWEADEFANYAYEKIISFYLGYKLSGGDTITFDNTIFEDAFGKIYTQEDIKKLDGAEQKYEDFYKKHVLKTKNLKNRKHNPIVVYKNTPLKYQ